MRLILLISDFDFTGGPPFEGLPFKRYTITSGVFLTNYVADVLLVLPPPIGLHWPVGHIWSGRPISPALPSLWFKKKAWFQKKKKKAKNERFAIPEW